MTARTVAFRVDASRAIGGGHAIRCLTLARALVAAGFEPRFYVNPGFEEAVPPSLSAGMPLVPVETEAAFRDQLHADHPGGADLLVFDHYGLDAAAEQAVFGIARATLVIDDLVDRRHACDLLLDQTVGRRASEYAAMVLPDCVVLAGSDYSLLRPEFADLRPAALARREEKRERLILLVSMGLTDVGGISGKLLEALGEHAAFQRIQVVLGDSAPSWPVARALATLDHRIELVRAGTIDVARMMANADVAIGAAGSTSWERCCLGLPTVMLQLADNQTEVVSQLVGRGAAWLAHSPAEACALAARLAADLPARTAMTAAAARLVDGNGAARVVQAINARLTAGE